MADERYEFSGNVIHVHIEDDCEVWLNTEGGDFDGLCIGAALERADALQQALIVLGDAVDAVKRALRDGKPST